MRTNERLERESGTLMELMMEVGVVMVEVAAACSCTE